MAFGFEITSMFFDRPAVVDMVDKKERRVLSQFGAFVRRTARRSITKTKKKVSAPGSPPKCHSPEPNLRTIFFAYDQRTHSVVVGPVYLNQSRSLRTYASNTIPNVLEQGGVIKINEKRVGRRWVTMGRRNPRPGQPTRTRPVRIAPRPFMRPALEAEVDGFPDLWASTVT